MNGGRLPVFLLTGFLGSGKTTLLQAWLKHPALADTAVVINEAGAVGIDGVLVGRASENVRVIEGGCVCCTVLDDLGAAIEALLDARDSSRVPAFSRLLVETSGMADPRPVAASLLRDPRVCSRVRHAGTIVVVDGLSGADIIDRFPEARAQLRLADEVILTKSDLGDDTRRGAIEDTVAAVNPAAAFRWSSRGSPAIPAMDYRTMPRQGRFQPAANAPGSGFGNHAVRSHERSSLQAHAFRFTGPVNGVDLVEAIDLMEQLFQGGVVRSKSLFRDSQTGVGYALHSVQGIIDIEEVEFGEDEQATGLVVFTQTIPRERLHRLFAPFIPVAGGQSPERMPKV